MEKFTVVASRANVIMRLSPARLQLAQLVRLGGSSRFLRDNLLDILFFFSFAFSFSSSSSIQSRLRFAAHAFPSVMGSLWKNLSYYDTAFSSS